MPRHFLHLARIRKPVMTWKPWISRNCMESPLRGNSGTRRALYLFSAPSAACGANAHAGRGVPIDVIVTQSPAPCVNIT